MTRSTKVRAARVAVAVVLMLLANDGVRSEGIIRRKGTRFVDKNCQEFMYSGWNSWQLLEAAAGLTGLDVGGLFDQMSGAGLTVGRFFGHGSGRKSLRLQSSPGVYNGGAMAALDRILDEAGKRGLKMILTMTDNWNHGDGKKMYSDWAGKSTTEFYTDPGIKSTFKDHIMAMTNRVNTVNGKKYKDDDTIFAWNLMNEPRCDCDVEAWEAIPCDPGCANKLQSWIEEMSFFLKSVDPNHLVTVGEEGFYSFGSGKEWANPDQYNCGSCGEWALRSGQDFFRNHNVEAIDYAAIHVWPDNWGVDNVGFQDHWVQQHINDAAAMGKPLVVEEFGKIAPNDDGSRKSVRDPFFRSMYGMFNGQRGSGGPMKGVGFWEFRSGGNVEDYVINPGHSTWTEIIVPESQKLVQELATRTVEGCVPGPIRSYDTIYIGTQMYLTGGANMRAANPKGDLIGEKLGSDMECATLCNGHDDCTAFTYNPGSKACVLHSGSGIGLFWDEDGWQTYWKDTASEEHFG